MANPIAAITRLDALRGNVVRLECPHELPERVWDGPIYTRLREARHIQPGHRSPFVINDSSRRPGWVCDLIHQRYDPNESSVPSAVDTEEGLADVVNPYSRLTGPSEDLSRELRDRPLLLLFRSSLAGATEHPVAAIPTAARRGSDPGGRSWLFPSASDSELQRLLRDAFVPRGSDTSVDFGISAISLATEFGRVISINSLEYTRTYIDRRVSTSRVDEDADSDSESATDILATGMSCGRPLPRDLLRIVSLDTPLRLGLPNEEQWISADTRGIIQQRGAAPADPGLPSVGTVAEAPPVTVAAGEAVVATLMSLAQATQQMVATTQQLPLVDSARVATVDVLDNAAVQAHGGETATDQEIGSGARLDVTQATIEAEAEAATTFNRIDGHSENPVALSRLGDRHRVIIVGAHIGNGTASIATAIVNALDIVIAHGGVLDTRTDKYEWIGIISDRSAMLILTRLVSWTYGTQEEVTFNGLTPIPVRSFSTFMIKTDVAHAMEISYITQSQN
ncbi:hypothetical protein GN244_ATG08115 [Phytophthora infestans]|uniref:Uncharacterized protein n=1 Tax=Phytophthora infestans TaxID=4787 RepID=A0A833WF72_PHYIN|nr:hypothetical protein GN244_ATG08115 [Phytophthora infestans]